MVKDAVPLEACARALVVKLRHHGDVLLAAPVFSVLKAHAPRLEVDALVYDDTLPMLAGHPALAALHTIGRRWKTEPGRLAKELRLFRTLRERRYDVLVHLTEHPRGAWLARALGVRYSVAPSVPGRRGFWRRSFTHFYPVVRGGRRHQVELNLDALRRIGLQPGADERKVVFVPGAEAQAAVAKLLPAGGFVHLHPASRWRFKCWPAEKNAALIDGLSAAGHEIVITCAPDPDELALVASILEKTTAKVVNLAGKLSIKELGALTARARLFIGVDSMPLHLAAAMGTPSVALFGPSGDSEWGPWNVPNRVIASRHTCRPCGYDGCGGGKVSECLTVLEVAQVHSVAQELLAQAAR